MIAALFVASNGPYFGVDGVDPWDRVRDARLYRGKSPVVAHPDCARWGRYAKGGPNPSAVRRLVGDDEGCFAHALWCARTFGGVIEHPADSIAFTWFGLPKPDKVGGWTDPDRYGGRSCHVEQGNYGHPARKATWLYAVSRNPLPELKWGPSAGRRLEEGFHSSEERARARALQVSGRFSGYQFAKCFTLRDRFSICSFKSQSARGWHETV